MKIVHPAVLLPPNMPSESYFDCRFAVLRAPLGFERGAERLADDDQAIHAWVPSGEHIVAVGRAHLIANDSDGSAPDHAGPNASKCPPFGPLSDPEWEPEKKRNVADTPAKFFRCLKKLQSHISQQGWHSYKREKKQYRSTSHKVGN